MYNLHVTARAQMASHYCAFPRRGSGSQGRYQVRW